VFSDRATKFNDLGDFYKWAFEIGDFVNSPKNKERCLLIIMIPKHALARVLIFDICL
jgi:hypothetical protein